MIPDERIICHTLRAEVDVEEVECAKEVASSDVWKFALDQMLVDHDPPSLRYCVYRGEGNANVVLGLPLERKVIRFRKSSPGEAAPDGGRARITREVEFLRHVISALLGDYVQVPETVRGTPEDMIKLSQAINRLRPEHRRTKDIVEEYATKYPDYAFLPPKLNLMVDPSNHPTFCVEIKPKQGFRHEMDESFQKCTYCLTQYHKLKTGAITARSSYCPFDLFSGDIARMKKAVRGLLAFPQNNLKIFRNGLVVYDVNSRPCDAEQVFAEWFGNVETNREQYFDVFFGLVSTALLRQFSRSQGNPPTHLPVTAISNQDFNARPRIDPVLVAKAKEVLKLSSDRCNFVSAKLPRGSVLERVLHMQQLPYHSAEVVYNIHTRHIGELNNELIYSQLLNSYKNEIKDSTIDRNGEKPEAMFKDFDSSCSEATKRGTAGTRLPDSGGNENTTLPYSEQRNDDENHTPRERGATITVQDLRALQNYLLVTTARDCSILMTFLQIDYLIAPHLPQDCIVAPTDRLNFAVNVSVLDLDPKGIHCIRKHQQRDCDVLASLTNDTSKEL